MNHHSLLTLSAALLVGGAACVHAQTSATPPASPATPPAAAAAAPAAPAAPAGPTAMTTPSMSGPLAANGDPFNFDGGPLGKVYFGGVVSGLAFSQDHFLPGDKDNRSDIDNAQLFLQNTSGIFQFFVQAGYYSLPSLGAEYFKTSTTTTDAYGVVPVAFVKIVPDSAWTIMVGKLPTIIGDEYTFSYQNMNIERGLLWNQEPAISRGAQVNYVKGPVTFELSWNDAFYSKQYNGVSGGIVWAIDSSQTLSFLGAGNTKTTKAADFATPPFQNNEQIYNIIYSKTAGAWTISPYVQWTHVGANSLLSSGSANTEGYALLLNYTFDAKGPLAGFSLPARAEYITSSGSPSGSAASLLYGPGSSAWSYTITPTYQYKLFYLRAEASYVGTKNVPAGFGFGAHGTDTSQKRIVAEAGILF